MLNSTRTLREIFEQALLSSAAYGNLRSVDFADRERLLSLLGEGQEGNPPIISPASALYLADKFGVVHHQPNTEFGYSATLFRRRELIPGDPSNGFTLAIRGTEVTTRDDLRADILQVLFSGAAWHQRAAMLIHWDGMTSGAPDYSLDANTVNALNEAKINVTGHSLGGHLAMWFANDRPGALGHAFTFNAPGLVHADRAGVPWDRVSHVISDQYPDLIAGLYATGGSEDRFFIESGLNAGLMAGHSSNNLLNGVASAYLLSLMDSSLSLEDMRTILSASARDGTQTFEAFAAALRNHYGIAPVPGEVDGDATIFGLIGRFEDGAMQPGEVISLANRSVPDLVHQASAGNTEGAALRHALVNALPFAIVGGTAIDPAAWMAGDFSQEYLQARAEYVHWLLRSNDTDAVVPEGLGAQVSYADLASGITLAGMVSSPYQIEFQDRVIFGTPGADDRASLTGGSGDDRIFGGEGDDELDGGVGSDYLEGGSGGDILRSGGGAHDTLSGGTGDDLYFVDRNTTAATVIDSDGAGTIAVAGEANRVYVLGNGLAAIPGQAGAALDAEGNRYVLMGDDLHVSVVNGQSIAIRDFSSGDLGIALPTAVAAANPPVPPGLAPFFVSPSNPDGFNGERRLRYTAGTPVYGSAWLNYYYPGGGAFPFSEWIDLSQAPLQTGFSSLAAVGGLGDSYIVGSPHRDSIVDDFNGSVMDGHFWATADVPGNDVLLGGDGDDVLETHGGNDHSFGGEGNDLLLDIPIRLAGTSLFGDVAWVEQSGHSNWDFLYGEAGDDVIVASAGDAYLDGGAGNDELYGGAHADMLIGGAGDDVLAGDARLTASLWSYAYPAGVDLTVALTGRIAEDVVAPGADVLDGGDGDDKLLGGGGNDTLLGGAGNDQLQGDTLFVPAGTRGLSASHGLTPLALHGADRLRGGAGNDLLYGGGGTDLLEGDGDDDFLYGGDGEDVLHGGDGADYLVGDDAESPSAEDELYGGAGNDTLFGMGGADRLYGEAGTDTLIGGDGDDALEGGEGDDWSATGSAGLYGQGGNDVLRGGAGRDRLQGGLGDDRLEADSGGDLLFGEEGNDTFVLSRGAGAVQITDELGVNRLMFGSGIDRQAVGVSMSGGTVRVHFSAEDHAFMSVATFRALAEMEFTTGETLAAEDVQHLFIPSPIGSNNWLTLNPGTTFADVRLQRWNDDLLLIREGDAAAWADTASLTARNVLFSITSSETYGLSPGSQVLTLTNWYRADPRSYLNSFITWDGSYFPFAEQAALAPATFSGTARSELRFGTTGNDTYLHSTNGGHDVLMDEGGTDDRLVLDASVSVADLNVQEVAEGLRVSIGNNSSVLFANWAQGSDSSVDGILLADGTLLDRQALDALNAGNHSPRAQSGIQELYVQRDQPFSLSIPANLFSDTDAGDALTYAAWTADGGGLPTWLTFDAETRRFSGTPAAADAGTVTVAVVATDNGGLSARVTFDLTVVLPVEVLGTEGNDWIVRDQDRQSQHILGFGGDDLLWAGPGADYLDGGAGNDHVGGGAGDDIVIGGPGNDLLGGDGGWQDVGNDRLYGGDGDDNLQGGPGVDVLYGENGNDTLWGTSNLIVGDGILFGGGSEMHGGAGDDLYYVRSGLDSVIEQAGEGFDSIASERDHILPDHVERLYLLNGEGRIGTGNTLDNELIGNWLDNTLIGGAGNDLLDGGEGADLLDGGEGNDTYLIDNAGDVVVDAAGMDTVQSRVSYVLGAGIEHLVMQGGLQGTGNTLNNTLTTSASITLAGGAGDDTYVLPTLSGNAVEQENEGIDIVFSGVTRTLGASIENLTLTGTGAVNGTGNAQANRLVGNAGANTLNGAGGADVMLGGAGDDVYVVDHLGDTVIEQAGEGVDSVQTTLSWMLGDNFENLMLMGAAAASATGNAFGNNLTGNAADNVLDGRAGADTLRGNAGNDVYWVDQSGDIVIEAANQGTDTVNSTMDWILGSNLENLVLLGSASLNGTGNTLANSLTGNGGNNLLDGGGGADTMQGGMGDDIYVVDTSGDITAERTNEGIDGVQSRVTRTLADNIEVLFLTGTAAVNGTGNALANLIRGNTAANRLAGGSGIDILEGGQGNDVLSDSSGRSLLNGGEGTDTLTGTAGNDLLIGGRGNDVLSSGSGADLILFNRGDGQDTVAASNTRDNTLSLGGGIAYGDLRFQRSGSNLILLAGAGDQITFSGYYSSAANRSVDRLQIVIENSADYRPGSTDALRNRRVESFNFDRLVAAFDTARAANPSLTTWSLAGSLTGQHLGGSDTAAMGGDLAYRYGLTGSLSDISFTPALGLLGANGFGTAQQSFLPSGALQDGSARLM